MPLFKSKAQKAQQARDADATHHDMNDPHTAPQGHSAGPGVGAGAGAGPGAGPGIGANDYAQSNNAPGHTNAVGRHEGGGRHQHDNVNANNAPPGYTGTGHHNGGPVDRAEQHVENIVGAKAVRNQAGDKESEVNAIKAQSAELTEAERLEREAKMHRDRAVAGGAHPANQRLGAGWAN
ncbi:hypothetical protein EVJ58_g5059 [Rhodofomes roseus]|uniref:Uncharacterized protein n=1 Tax=Rhodofomes roseus TaxID=34475 RepID=A0A4Y9YDF6_9APHY|nr:hypothetical protein EVJ58_g5059 [Rhodofomes roseus]